jgi:uncharacterized protein (TIGR02145 family)
LYGKVYTNSSDATGTFEYGTSAAYGQSVSADPSSAQADNSTNITGQLIGLAPTTTYHYRVKAVSTSETFYGKDLTLNTFNTLTVKDIDDNVYNSVTIGTQVWITENLKVTRYNDGSAVPLITDDAAWAALSTHGYCWYNNDAATYKAAYGALYNSYTIKNGKLCPTGWHVPTRTEWTVLSDYLGGESYANGKLREIGTVHWRGGPSPRATNESGFTALPGGRRFDSGTFDNMGDVGFWWSSTDYEDLATWNWAYNAIVVSGGSFQSDGLYDKKSGYSVRCLKDL